MRRYIASIFLTFISVVTSFSQTIYVNTAVDTTKNNDNKMIFRLWKSYLQSKPDSLYDNPFWNTAEKNQYKSYDLLKSEGFTSPSLYYWADYNSIIILSITRQGEYFVIRSMFYRETTEGTIAVTAIINTLAKKLGEDFYLFNYLPFSHPHGFEEVLV